MDSSTERQLYMGTEPNNATSDSRSDHVGTRPSWVTVPTFHETVYGPTKDPESGKVDSSVLLSTDDRRRLGSIWRDAVIEYMGIAKLSAEELFLIHQPFNVEAIFPQAKHDWECPSQTSRRKERLRVILMAIFAQNTLIDKLTDWAKNVAFPPTQALWGCVAILLKAVRQTADAYDTITKLFESMSFFLMRYKMVITKSPVTKPLAETFAVMMVDILKVCGISRRYLRRGMFRKFPEISSDLGTYLHNIWSSDSELAGILEHFQKLANEEIAAGVAQLHIMMAESNKHLNRINSNIFGEATNVGLQSPQIVSSRTLKPEIPGKLTLAKQLIPGPRARHFLVPHPPNRRFIGRTGVLRKLNALLSSEKHGHNSVALYGLGGIGKTQIAAEYAHRHRNEYLSIFWVGGASRRKLVSDYVGIASQVLNVSGPGKNPAGIAATLKLWFESEEASREKWLLIVDAADNIGEIQEFLPRAGNLLVTTRDQLVAGSVVHRGIEIEQMSVEEATTLLLRGVGLEDEEQDPAMYGHAWLIVKELGFLPLAIEQSAAYIRETRCSLSSYLESWKTSRSLMLNISSKRRSSFSDEYGKTVAATWTISFRRLAAETPTAAELLSLFAFFDCESIPEDLVREGLTGLHGCSRLQDIAGDAVKFDEAISSLNLFSLIRRRSGNRSIQLHVLLSHVIQDWIKADDSGSMWATRALDVVSRAFPAPSCTGPEVDMIRRRLIPHVFMCLQHATNYNLVTELGKDLFYAAGVFLLSAGVYDGADKCFIAVVAYLDVTVGRNQTSTARALVFLSIAYQRAGRWDDAQSLGEEALTIYENVCGLNHVYLVQALHNLGHAFKYKGQMGQANVYYKRALNIIQQQDAKSHNELPWLLVTLGLEACSECLWEEAHSLLSHALQFPKMREDRYYAAVALRSMGKFWYYQGEWAKSRELFEEALQVRQKSLGIDNPDTASYLCNLATVLIHEGRLDLATSLLQQALRLQEEALRTEHFGIAYHLSGLGAILAKKGDLDEAKVMYKRALTIRERVQGRNPSELAWTVNSLAAISVKLGSKEAEALFKSALDIRWNHFGASHPDTQGTIRQLIAYYQVQGRYDEATTMWAKLPLSPETAGHGKVKMFKVYRAEAYLDDGIQSSIKQGLVLEYETVWSAKRWVLFPMCTFRFAGLPVVPVSVFGVCILLLTRLLLVGE